MKKYFVFGLLCILLMVTANVGFAGKIATPPSIMMPYGSDITTEVYLTDNDLLNVVKDMLPKLVDVIQGTFGQVLTQGVPVVEEQKDLAESLMQGLDIKAISEAITEVNAIRLLIATYNAPKNSAGAGELFDMGIKKMGSYSRVMYDVRDDGTTLSLYAQTSNKGYAVYHFDAAKKTIYAVRIEGFLDVQKIMTLVIDAGTKFLLSPPELPGFGE